MSRIILKISGEALKNDNNNVSNKMLEMVLKIVNLLKDNHQIGIVVGGGNFFRGREHPDMQKVTADTIGMLGTVMNALYLKDYLIKNSINVTVSTPFDFLNLIDIVSFEELNSKYNNGEVIIFGGGIGKSGYSTDTGAIFAADKLNSDLIIKLTNVDGVYDSDPKINKNAVKYDKLSYDEVLEKNLKVMDTYAIAKCKEKKVKVLVMNFNDYKSINKYFNGESIGTIIGG